MNLRWWIYVQVWGKTGTEEKISMSHVENQVDQSLGNKDWCEERMNRIENHAR